ncbi:metal ABC transporter ATP-binding protein [Glutamicibacter sp. 287]|uniref:metal ABC transporter ATP-binding protein n=1 Tax=unclassified Glutamicibacter TaxID=2627139 RepID=UPI000BB80EF4|nr:metal ABC transporter ATP-binding protein [Glutamicibacter sp. BW80]PCC30353.1 ABC transporter [Glutamicibacter sp. BW80]
MPPAISLKDVTVQYGTIRALEQVTLDINPHRVCALIGMNGSGKSTLFKTIMGLVHPVTGTVLVNSHNPAAERKRAGISYVPQHEDIDWAFPLSVREVVMTGRYGKMGLTRRARTADHQAVNEALEKVELTQYADRQIGQLSGGQKKRAFVARGIAQEAKILLLDEPFAGVDKRSEATITRLIRELAYKGATVVVSTHDLQALPELADEAILLMRRVLMHSSPENVLQPENLAMAFGLDVLAKG